MLPMVNVDVEVFPTVTLPNSHVSGQRNRRRRCGCGGRCFALQPVETTSAAIPMDKSRDRMCRRLQGQTDAGQEQRQEQMPPAHLSLSDLWRFSSQARNFTSSELICWACVHGSTVRPTAAVPRA